MKHALKKIDEWFERILKTDVLDKETRDKQRISLYHFIGDAVGRRPETEQRSLIFITCSIKIKSYISCHRIRFIFLKSSAEALGTVLSG